MEEFLRKPDVSSVELPSRPFRSRRDARLFLTQAVLRPLGTCCGLALALVWSFPWGAAFFAVGTIAYVSRGRWLSPGAPRAGSGLLRGMERHQQMSAMDGAPAWTDALKAAGLDVAWGLYVRKIVWGVSIGSFLIAFLVNLASRP